MANRNVLCVTLLCVVCALAGHQPGHAQSPAGQSLSSRTPWVRLIAPNGGETLYLGENSIIYWTSHHIPQGDIILVLYANGVKAAVISAGCPNSGRFEWQIPPDLVPGGRYRVRIRWSNQPGINDFSDADFHIRSREN